MDTAEETIVEVTPSKTFVVGVVGTAIVGLGIGLVTYLIRRRNAEGEVYVYNDPPRVNLVIDAADMEKIRNSTPIIPQPEEDEAPPVVTANVFAGPVEEWDYQKEISYRSKLADGTPYILHKDEFFEEHEDEYLQVTITYYEGDQMLADEDDKPIFNADEVIGDLRFGHGSGDPNTFYVRNDARRMEYEVLRHSGHYAVEVEGLVIEEEADVKTLKHSHSGPRRFRARD